MKIMYLVQALKKTKAVFLGSKGRVGLFLSEDFLSFVCPDILE